MKQARLTLVVGISIFLLSACNAAQPTGKLAYMVGFGDKAEIYVMNADGSNPVRLTNNTAFDRFPAWSPDGKRIAFTSDLERKGFKAIYVMNADGSKPIRITAATSGKESPAWSPDGKRIAYVTSTEGRREDIWTVDDDGSNAIQLTNDPAADKDPAWSPDGKRIVFSSERAGKAKLYVMNADGSNPVPLTNNAYIAEAYSPAWSPDGKQIVFYMSQDVWVIGADGNNARCLTCKDHVSCSSPVWSPDGKFIAYSASYSGRDEKSEIYVMNADGTNPRRLTSNGVGNTLPTWTR